MQVSIVSSSGIWHCLVQLWLQDCLWIELSHWSLWVMWLSISLLIGQCRLWIESILLLRRTKVKVQLIKDFCSISAPTRSNKEYFNWQRKWYIWWIIVLNSYNVTLKYEILSFLNNFENKKLKSYHNLFNFQMEQTTKSATWAAEKEKRVVDKWISDKEWN